MRWIVLLLILPMMVLSACQPGSAENKISVDLSDFMISPDAFTVKAGAVITVNVTNSGAIQHDFNIMKLGSEIGGMIDEDDRANVLWGVKVEPGETLTATFTVPEEPGLYQVICSLPGHLQAGMVGSINVIK